MNHIVNPIVYERSPSPLYTFRYPKPFNDLYKFSLIKIFIITKKLRLVSNNNNLDCSDIITIINYYFGSIQYYYRNNNKFLASLKFKDELYETVYNKKHKNVGMFIGINLNKHWELINAEESDKPFNYNLNNNSKKKINPKIITKKWINKNINIYPG